MIVLGLVLLLIGYLLPIPLLFDLGVILLVVGAILWLLGAAGHPVVYHQPRRRSDGPVKDNPDMTCI